MKSTSKAVLKKERSSPIRAIEKIFKKDEKSDGEMAALKEARQLAASDCAKGSE